MNIKLGTSKDFDMLRYWLYLFERHNDIETLLTICIENPVILVSTLTQLESRGLSKYW